MKRIAALLIPLLMLIPVMSGATSSAPPAVIQIQVFSDPLMGARTYHVLRERTAAFGASIEFPGGFLSKGDVYFGFLQPGNMNAHTWTLDSGTVRVVKGMRPLQQDIDLTTPPVFYTSAIAGRDLEHAFAGTDPAGMYSMFVLVVIANSDPGDSRNWYAVSTLPLFVE